MLIHNTHADVITILETKLTPKAKTPTLHNVTTVRTDRLHKAGDGLLLLSTHSHEPCYWGSPIFQLVVSQPAYLSSSAVTPAGCVHKYRGDNVGFCCCRPTPPCLFGGVLPYFEVTGHPVPVSSLGCKCPDCFIWNCSYIVYPSMIKGPFRDNMLRYVYL